MHLKPAETGFLLASMDMETQKKAIAARIAHFQQQTGKVESIKYWTPGAESIDANLN